MVFDYDLSTGFVFNAKMAARIKADERSVDDLAIRKGQLDRAMLSPTFVKFVDSRSYAAIDHLLVSLGERLQDASHDLID